MIFKIVWSEFAETQLDDIFEYYKKETGVKIASKLIKEIINEPEKLINAPYIGQEEELLKEGKIQYRYLICKKYKLIYTVDIDNGLIKIADVFHTQQNPIKITRYK